MKTYVVNLGLNNNSFDAKEAQAFLESEQGQYLIDQEPLVSFTDFSEMMGSWEGADEPTLVFKMHVNTDKIWENVFARAIAQHMCIIFTQQAIAFRDVDAKENDGRLVYSPKIDSRPYEFDKKYFIDPFRRDENDVRSRIMSRLGK